MLDNVSSTPEFKEVRRYIEEGGDCTRLYPAILSFCLEKVASYRFDESLPRRNSLLLSLLDIIEEKEHTIKEVCNSMN